MRILFMCVANSARSQMAEGLARAMAPAEVSVCSAGSDPATVRPLAVEVLREVGLDISHHRSKGLADISLNEIDVVITLCAEEVCPTVPGLAHLHWPIEDPAGHDQESREQQLARFRRARDELTHRLEEYFAR